MKHIAFLVSWSLAFAACLALILNEDALLATPAESAGSLVRAEARVSYRKTNDAYWHTAHKGDSFESGTTVGTDQSGRATIALEDGRELQIQGNTQVTLARNLDQRTQAPFQLVTLLKGALEVKPARMARHERNLMERAMSLVRTSKDELPVRIMAKSSRVDLTGATADIAVSWRAKDGRPEMKAIEGRAEMVDGVTGALNALTANSEGANTDSASRANGAPGAEAPALGRRAASAGGLHALALEYAGPVAALDMSSMTFPVLLPGDGGDIAFWTDGDLRGDGVVKPLTLRAFLPADPNGLFRYEIEITSERPALKGARDALILSPTRIDGRVAEFIVGARDVKRLATRRADVFPPEWALSVRTMVSLETEHALKEPIRIPRSNARRVILHSVAELSRATVSVSFIPRETTSADAAAAWVAELQPAARKAVNLSFTMGTNAANLALFALLQSAARFRVSRSETGAVDAGIFFVRGGRVVASYPSADLDDSDLAFLCQAMACDTAFEGEARDVIPPEAKAGDFPPGTEIFALKEHALERVDALSALDTNARPPVRTALFRRGVRLISGY